LKKIKPVFLKYLFALVLIVLSIPTVIGNFVEFYGSHPNAIIDNNEISALNYLKNNSKLGDIILTPPFDNGSKYDYKTSPLPIYAWSATGYVSSLTDRETYLSDEEMASQTGYDVNTRLDEENKFFSQKDFSFNLDFLKNNKIAYIYVPTPRKYSLQEEDNHLTTVFSNDEVNIYRVDN
jgi:uncharacterized membrane protein